ncbi:hypothetical protein F5I97DRAFT_1984747 [Phlebopus sp. FC_14]|nr:hypothetical protein F5I97DRAFT_1984747 [Phlebopus sp. FC_14]
MFSSFSAFLPSVLQPNLEQRASQPPSTPQQQSVVSSVERPEQPAPTTAKEVSGTTAKKKDKKEKPANETFIVVRPPPSKSNHPLNLQVQLVPPQSRHDKPSVTIQALDTSAQDANDPSNSTDLRRTASNRSDSSTYSGYTSATSVSSFASSSTTSSGRRMIIPLYNLHAHNVMTNTIVDAGTDAKVAKFARRGLEIVGLAIFEPIEVWGSVQVPGALPSGGSNRTSIDDALREHGLLSHAVGHRSLSPDRPATSHSTVQGHRDLLQVPNVSVSPLPSEPGEPQRGAKKLFTRMFKKKEATRPLSTVVSSPAEQPIRSSPLVATATTRFLNEDADPLETPKLTDMASCTPVTGTATLCPPVLGIQPTLYPPTAPPKGRPTKYVWVTRKWLKGTEGGLVSGMMGKLSMNGRNDSLTSGALQVEVRFEWSRGRRKEGRGRKGRADRKISATSTAESRSVSRRGSAVVSNQSLAASIPGTAPHTVSLSPQDVISTNNRHSIISHHSTSSETETSVGSSAAHRAGEDSGDESDPEDSETPWTCAVTIQRLGALLVPHTGELNAQRERVMRLKVATLSPTPHHPKVVGLLKVPFPLPDIEVEQLVVRRRVVTAQGVSRSTSESGGLMLTAEEIKDTVSSTALWLVVREAFGGVGRERRKGDGWRIRA